MARTYGLLKVSIWEPNSDFRQLPPLPQWAYVMLISQPQLNNLGIVPYTPERWVRFAIGLTVEDLEGAIDDLEEEGFVIVDRNTAELLVRTFIKHDKVWSQPKLVTNARKLIWEVESETIRNYLAKRHPWLLDSRSKEEIELWEASQATLTETPSDTPNERAIETPSVRGMAGGISPAGAQDVRASHAPAGPGVGAGVGVSQDVEELTRAVSASSYDDEPSLEPDPELRAEPRRTARNSAYAENVRDQIGRSLP